MSVLIKGMEMPTSCYICPCFNDEYYDCQATGKDLCDISIDSRYSDCPLVSVPPHGRLIDADELGLTDFEIVMCDGNYKKGLEMLAKKIEDAPTVIPADKGGET